MFENVMQVVNRSETRPNKPIMTSSGPANKDSPPSTFSTPPTLSEFQVSSSQYVASQPDNPQKLDTKPDHLATGIIVFNGPRILLIQRSLTDSMPGRWETAGGAVDSTDSTILHGAARELWEETGLHAQRFISAVGNPWSFRSRSGKNVLKFNFIADVEETGGFGDAVDGEVRVKLDPKEHRAWVWASRDDVLGGRVAGVEVSMASEQRRVILDAFDERDEFLRWKASGEL